MIANTFTLLHNLPKVITRTFIFQIETMSYVKLDSILKSKELSVPTKVFIVKAMVFSVVIYECENFTIMKS